CHRRSRIHAHHRTGEGHRQPRRGEDPGRRGGAAAAHPPGGPRGRDRRDARSAPRRAGLRVRCSPGAVHARRDADVPGRAQGRQTVLARTPGDGGRAAAQRGRQGAEVRVAGPAGGGRRRGVEMTQSTEGDAAFEALAAEVEAFVRGPGEEYAREIERTRAVPQKLWDDLRERGYLGLAAPAEYGGAGLPFSRYLELLELFSMSHA